MATARSGPAVQTDAGFWTQAQDLLFDSARYKLGIDTQHASDSSASPSYTSVRSAQGGPAQRATGFGGAVSAGGVGALLVGGAVVLGLAWMATS